jgi:hypothetical protein
MAGEGAVPARLDRRRRAPRCFGQEPAPLVEGPVAGDAEGDALVHTTAVSLLDRLIHHSVVVVIDGESYRMREARQRGGGRATKKR